MFHAIIGPQFESASSQFAKRNPAYDQTDMGQLFPELSPRSCHRGIRLKIIETSLATHDQRR